MKEYIKIYYLYRTALIKTIRILLLFFLLLLIFLQFQNELFILDNLRMPIFFLSIFLMIEIFFRFKIANISPATTISLNSEENISESFTRPLLYLFIVKQDSKSLLKNLIRFKQVKFILEKADISEKELTFVDFPKKEMIRYTLEVAKSINGKFVTTMDFITAYLIYSEPQTKLLFNKQLKPEQLFHILQWARMEFASEENPKKTRVIFNENGIGEALVAGWTLETKKYTNDLTYQALKHRPLTTGRKVQYKAMLEALSKKENNNALLVGERGVGKDALVEALAYDSFIGKLPANSNHKKILELLVGSLLAGAENRNELEVRIKNVIDEVSHSGNVMLYIPEFQNIVGGSSFNLDISGTLLPYLKHGGFPIIAAITPGNYKLFMEKSSLLDVFEVVKMDEPDKNTALQMLFEKAAEIERKNKVVLTYAALITAVDVANRYFQDSFLPGSAVNLIEDVASSVALAHEKVVLKEDIVKKIEEKTKISISAPKDEEKELLLHLEEKLHERIVDQVEAVRVISEAMRRIRTGLTSQSKPISFLFLGPTGVGKTETAKALAVLYFGGEEKMVRLDMSEYTDESGINRLLGAPPGKGEERGELTEKIHDNPFSLVLLDEFEKAHSKTLDLFLQVFDDGRLTDNKGRTVSFANTIIIATSNAGSEFIREEVGKGAAVDKQFQQRLLEFLQTSKLFKPELLNRFDDIVTFKPLGEKEVWEITKLLLDKLTKTLLEKDIMVSFDEKIVAKVTKEGFDQQFGARPLRRYIQDNIEELLAQKILKSEVKRGNTVAFSTDNANNLTVAVTERL